MSYPFLSEEWIVAAREIRHQHEGEIPEITTSLRINQVVTDVPFGEGTIHSYLDTSSGELVMELGELDEPDATITTDYVTAKAIFVDGDPAVAMQAFMMGKIVVQGDMMKLMALQTAMPIDERSIEVAAEIQAITSD